MAPPAPLTLKGLADLLGRHSEQTAARFREVERQIEETTRQIGETNRRVGSLAGQVDALLGLIRDQGLRLIALAEQQAEQQTQIRQILHRLEQHDGLFQEVFRRLEEQGTRLEQHAARLEQHDGYIRRMLDLLERRGGDGGPHIA